MKFQLKEKEYIALCDLLKVTGVCQSGGEAKELIASGKVFLNEDIEKRKRCKIYAGAKVRFEDMIIEVEF